MQVQVKLLLDQEGQRLHEGFVKAQRPVEGGLEFVRGKASYFFLRDFYGAREMVPPGRLWDPVLVSIENRRNVLVYRGFQLVGKAARAQEWSIYIGVGITEQESVDNALPGISNRDSLTPV